MFKSYSLRRTFRFMAGNIMVLSVTDLLGNLGRGLVFPYASLYILALGGDATQIGLVNSLAPLPGLIMFPIAGYIADHASRVKLMVLGTGLSAGLLLMCVLAPSWEMVAVATLLQGFLVFQFPAYSALIADALSPADRGKGIATMNTISSTLSIFAPYLAGIVIDSYGANMGMRALYGVMAALCLACVVIYRHSLKDTAPPGGEHMRLAQLPRVFRQAYSGIPTMLRQLPPSARALTGVVILSFMANGVASPFWVLYAVEHIKLSTAAWGLILLIETVLKTLMFIPAGMLVDRWGRTTSLLAALLLSLVSLPLFVFATSFMAALLIRAVIAAAFAIALPACTALMADMVPRSMRGRVMAVIGQGGIMIGPAAGGTGGPAVGFVITLPLMIASLAGGYLYAQNPAYPWLFVLITTLISIILTALFIRDPQRAEV